MASEYILVAPLIGVAAAEALEPVKKLVSYCAEAGNNVQNLEDAAENLIFIIDTMQINIESGQAQGRIISPEAEGWMARASVLASEVDAIMIRYAGRRVRLLGYSLNFWSIYSISKDAFLKQNDIKEHQNNRPNNDELFVQIPSLEPQVAVQELYFVDCILQVARRSARRCGVGVVGTAAFFRRFVVAFVLLFPVVRNFSRRSISG